MVYTTKNRVNIGREQKQRSPELNLDGEQSTTTENLRWRVEEVSLLLRSPRHGALRRFVVGKRKQAKLRQVDVAKRLGRYQSYITNIETGQRRIDVVELIDLAEAIGFDPREAITALTMKR